MLDLHPNPAEDFCYVSYVLSFGKVIIDNMKDEFGEKSIIQSCWENYVKEFRFLLGRYVKKVK
jgi:hypothetical protein